MLDHRRPQNGAGKTTFAMEYLPQMADCSRFINADLIAAGLSPLAPECELLAASRLFLSEIDAAIGEREDFAFETTLSRGQVFNIKPDSALVRWISFKPKWGLRSDFIV